MRILRTITITITSMTNNRSLLKYVFVLLILFISAAILSTNEGT
ncbi:BAX protein, partial [Francisella tularensis subsp. holarctica]|nr:BAX protein [Francisella tularensis subsp. holarctica]